MTEEIKPLALGEISGAQFIAQTFQRHGITHVFYMDGILRRALVEMEDLGITRVLAHCEKAAAYMADGYSRVRRGPGVCMAQSVGAANLAAGLQDPYLGRSAVVAITGRKDFIYQYRNSYQEIEHAPLFQPVTKFNAMLESPEQLPVLLPQAFRDAVSGVPGPVHLDVLGHIGQTTDAYHGSFMTQDAELYRNYPCHRPSPSPEEVKRAAALLAGAERPVILAGGGAVASGAGPAIVSLAQALAIPVATTLNGKQIILDRHPLALGVAGSYARWCANQVISEADLVIFIGTSAGDMATQDWRVPKLGTPVIQVDLDASQLGRNYPLAAALMGDAKATVEMLLEALDGQKPNQAWAQRAAEVVASWRQEFEPLWTSQAAPIRPERLCREISKVLPENAVLVGDTGHSGIWTGLMVELTHPGQTYLRAAGSLGWALPAAIGAKCGAPERPVVCFTGDGGLWYHLTELETAVRYGINTVVVVNNNHRLGQTAGGVKKAYGDKPGRPEDMYMLGEVNFARIAQEMGAKGIRVEDPKQIAGALKDALAMNAPVMVDVVTDGEAQAPWTPSY